MSPSGEGLNLLKPQTVNGDSVVEFHLSAPEAAAGGSFVLSIETEDGPVDFRISIPQNTRDGTKLRLRDRGPLQADGRRAHLYILCRVRASAPVQDDHQSAPPPVTEPVVPEGPSAGQILVFLVLAASSAVLLGGLPLLEGVEKDKQWIAVSTAALAAGLALYFLASWLTASLLRTSPTLASWIKVTVGASVLGAILAPAWAWTQHGEELRTKPLALLATWLPGHAGTWVSELILPAQNWDDTLLSGEKAYAAILFPSFSAEPLPAGTRLIFEVHNGTNGRLKELILDLSLKDLPLLQRVLFTPDDPILPGNRGKVRGVVSIRLPKQLAAGDVQLWVRDLTLLPFDRKAEFRRNLSSWLTEK